MIIKKARFSPGFFCILISSSLHAEFKSNSARKPIGFRLNSFMVYLQSFFNLISDNNQLKKIIFQVDYSYK